MPLPAVFFLRYNSIINFTTFPKSSTLMPVSHWDRLPPELKSNIISFADPYTRYINNDLTPQQMTQYGTEIWKIAFEMDYDGDLTQLPQDHFPNIHNGLKFVKSRSMYHRLCKLKANLADWDILKKVSMHAFLLCECSNNRKNPCYRPMNLCIGYKLLVHIPIIQGWTDLIPDWWKEADPCRIFIWACSIGCLDIVKDLRDEVGKSEYEYNVLVDSFAKAADNGYVDVIKFLLDAEIGKNVVKENFDDIMEKAATNGHVDLFSFLLENCIPENSPDDDEDEDVDKNDYKDGWTNEYIFEETCEHGHLEVIKILNTVIKAEHFAQHNKSKVLWSAVHSRNVDLVKHLVEDAGFNDEEFCNKGFLYAVKIGFLKAVAVLAKVVSVDIAEGRKLAVRYKHEGIEKVLSDMMRI
ncbi:hypothetical protein HDU76_004017 [Blyttiomyces sp. JEL0837]|nr:hypothetical protein HDU76_004017 [Blyttiomyces sp. JEL0837]